MNQRISRKKQQGYTEAIPKVGAKITNALGLPKPMLAKKWDGKPLKGTIFIQPKLDGNRCLIKIEDGVVFAYTRNGKEFTTINHITDEFKGVKNRTMIIEIKDMPSGQKLKHMIVDITFSETGDPIVISTTSTEKKQENTNIPSEMKDGVF